MGTDTNDQERKAASQENLAIRFYYGLEHYTNSLSSRSY